MAILTDLVVPLFADGLAADAPARDDVDERAERAAFTCLYERHARRVHRFLRDLLGDPALAADATQETFARAYHHHRDVLRDRERAVPWLFGVARNVSLELRRARARRSRVITTADPDLDAADARCPATPEDDVLGQETIRVVDAALAALSEERRAVLLLRMDHGLAYDEIATTMGFSLAKVKVELHRARAVLRETLDAHRRGAPRERGGGR